MIHDLVHDQEQSFWSSFFLGEKYQAPTEVPTENKSKIGKNNHYAVPVLVATNINNSRRPCRKT